MYTSYNKQRSGPMKGVQSQSQTQPKSHTRTQKSPSRVQKPKQQPPTFLFELLGEIKGSAVKPVQSSPKSVAARNPVPSPAQCQPSQTSANCSQAVEPSTLVGGKSTYTHLSHSIKSRTDNCRDRTRHESPYRFAGGPSRKPAADQGPPYESAIRQQSLVLAPILETYRPSRIPQPAGSHYQSRRGFSPPLHERRRREVFSDRDEKVVQSRVTEPVRDRSLRGSHPTKAHMIYLKYEAAKIAAGDEKSYKLQSTKKGKATDGQGDQQTMGVNKMTNSKATSSLSKKGEISKAKEGIDYNNDSGYSTRRDKDTGSLIASGKDEEDEESVLRTQRRPRRNAQKESSTRPLTKSSQVQSKGHKCSHSRKEDKDIEGKSAKKVKVAPNCEGVSEGNVKCAQDPRKSSPEHDQEVNTDADLSLQEIRVARFGQIGKLTPKPCGKQAPRNVVDSNTTTDNMFSPLGNIHRPADRKISIASTGPSSRVTAKNLPSTDDSLASTDETSSDQDSTSSNETAKFVSSEKEVASSVSDVTKKRKYRSSGDEEDTEKLSSKKAKTGAKRKPMGIPTEERRPGLMYTKNSDGTWNLKERMKKIGATAAPKTKAKAKYNFIKD